MSEAQLSSVVGSTPQFPKLDAAIRKEWVETARIGGTSVDHDPLSVSASALWHFQPQWTLGLSLARSQRAPSMKTRFF